MLAALVLASWWAQAEPAPAEPTPAPPVVSPAPPPVPVLNNRLDVIAGYARRLGGEGGAIGPRDGFGVGGGYERRIVPLPQNFEVGVGVDFRYQKFQTGVTGTATAMPGQPQTYSGDRTLSQ